MALKSVFADALGTMIGTGFRWGLAGLLLGILLVVLAGRWRLFQRPMGPWSILVKLNYVFWPLWCLALGVGLGALKGVHRIADDFIAQTTEPLLAYSEQYVRGFQEFVAALPATQLEGMTLESLIARNMGANKEAEPDSYSFEYTLLLNEAILTSVLEEMGIPPSAGDAQALLAGIGQMEAFTEKLDQLPTRLHGATARFFAARSWGLLLAFLPIIFLPLAEMLLYWAGCNALARRATHRLNHDDRLAFSGG